MNGNIIHPTAIIHPDARLGSNNYIGPYCYIGPNVTIGSNNRFEAYVSTGTAGEHRDYFHLEPGKVSIGDRNVIREFVTINGGTTSTTTLENEIVMLRGSHVGHDAYLSSKVNFSCNVLLGGHSIICEGANLGLSVVVHQHRVVGAYSMIGMNSTITKNIMPFVIAFGSPCEAHKVNRIGLLRAGLKDEELIEFEKWFFSVRGGFENVSDVNHAYSVYLEIFREKCQELIKLIHPNG